MGKNIRSAAAKAVTEVRCLQDIFDIAGSSTKLAAALEVHAFTAENWRRTGIPQKYWEKLYSLYGISPVELHSVYRSCRKAITAPSRVK